MVWPAEAATCSASPDPGAFGRASGSTNAVQRGMKDALHGAHDVRQQLGEREVADEGLGQFEQPLRLSVRRSASSRAPRSLDTSWATISTTRVDREGDPVLGERTVSVLYGGRKNQS